MTKAKPKRKQSGIDWNACGVCGGRFAKVGGFWKCTKCGSVRGGSHHCHPTHLVTYDDGQFKVTFRGSDRQRDRRYAEPVDLRMTRPLHGRPNDE